MLDILGITVHPEHVGRSWHGGAAQRAGARCAGQLGLQLGGRPAREAALHDKQFAEAAARQLARDALAPLPVRFSSSMRVPIDTFLRAAMCSSHLGGARSRQHKVHTFSKNPIRFLTLSLVCYQFGLFPHQLARKNTGAGTGGSMWLGNFIGHRQPVNGAEATLHSELSGAIQTSGWACKACACRQRVYFCMSAAWQLHTGFNALRKQPGLSNVAGRKSPAGQRRAARGLSPGAACDA